MSMERSDQQNLNLTGSTLSTINGGEKGQRHLYEHRRKLSWKVRISYKAQDTTCVFNNLMKHINPDTLREAFNAIDGQKAVGVDKITKSEYGKNLDVNIINLHKRLMNGSYRPIPKREVLIPKANGKSRPIAIAGFEDKLVDWCVGTILSEVYEPLFIRNSFGYRKNKSAHNAIDAIYYTLESGIKANVVEIDFSNFFNTIPHRKLMKIVKKRISDKRFLGLIYRLLTGEILKNTGDKIASTIGTPQGGIASPILANIYLNEVVDQWFIENYSNYNNIIVRYADDAVFFFKDEDKAQKFIKELKERVAAYGISLNSEKTHMLHMGKKSRSSFNFLGFTFYRGKQASKKVLKIKTQKERLVKAIKAFYDWIKAFRNRSDTETLWRIAKAKITGHLNYYGYSMNALKIHHFYSEARKALFKWLNRRSQKRSYTWSGFNERLKNFPLIKNFDEINWKQLGRSFGRV